MTVQEVLSPSNKATPSDRVMLHVCSMWHTNNVHRRLFERLYNVTGIKQIVIWPSKGSETTASASELSFGTLIEVPCLGRRTTLSSVWRGKKIFRALASNGYLDVFRNSNIAKVHSHSAYLDSFLGDAIATELGGVPHTISFRFITDVNFGFRFRPYATRAIKPIVDRAETLMIISLPDKLRIVRRLRVDPQRITYLGSGVDEDFINPAVLDKKQVDINPWRIITMGKRGHAYKRVDLTIRACADAAKDAGAEGWSLTVLGMSKTDYFDTYRDKKLSADTLEHVEFLGRVNDRSILRQLLYEHGLFVLPSKETFGIAYLEAISQCTPAIYLRQFGIDGLFEADTVGQAVEEPSTLSLKSAILQVVQVYNGKLGPFEINPVKRFSWENLARKYCDALKIELVNN